MIVDYLHVFGTRIGPPEHDPPLVIDADRVLTRQIALESFKAVAGRRVQGLKKGGGVHHNQFSASYPGEICRETLRDHATLKDRLGKFPLKAPDHEQCVSYRDTYCKCFCIPMRYYWRTPLFWKSADAIRSGRQLDHARLRPFRHQGRGFCEWISPALKGTRPTSGYHYQ